MDRSQLLMNAIQSIGFSQCLLREAYPGLKWDLGQSITKDLIVAIAVDSYGFRFISEDCAEYPLLMDDFDNKILVALDRQEGALKLIQEAVKVLVIDILPDGHWREIFFGDVGSLAGSAMNCHDGTFLVPFEVIHKVAAQRNLAVDGNHPLDYGNILSSNDLSTAMLHDGDYWQFFKELSPRELEVLTCLTLGMTNLQMSIALSVTTETVKSHVSSVLSKTRVKDRSQAAIAAIWHGISKLVDYRCDLNNQLALGSY